MMAMAIAIMAGRVFHTFTPITSTHKQGRKNIYTLGLALHPEVEQLHGITPNATNTTASSA